MSAIRSTIASKKIASAVSVRALMNAVAGSSVWCLRTNRSVRPFAWNASTFSGAISTIRPRATCSVRRHDRPDRPGTSSASSCRDSSRLSSNSATSAASWHARNTGTCPRTVCPHSNGCRALRFTTSLINQVAALTEMPFRAATSSGRNSSIRHVPSAPTRTARAPTTSTCDVSSHPLASANSAIATASSISARARASTAARSPRDGVRPDGRRGGRFAHVFDTRRCH